ncbi:DUF6925 family protein [Bosea sp. (in: a-proteobacteria)]|uniref:DUF6925 family protein n=1 Tax=Bosea sp. (in: a-proteobacteria) TaxID=1871050 RepID=UPI002FC96B8F
MTAPDIRELIRTQLLIETTQWNLGTFGAIAEFMRDPDEPATPIDEPGRLAAVTARGGIGFGDLAQLRPFASESVVGAGWSHRVALCLPAESCAMNRRTVLTELGRDRAALRAEDRDGLLFDMGLGTLQVDVCIRTADPGLIATLRSFVGRPLLEPGNPAMGAIVAAGPHRVFIARPGRCEVYQPIPPADGRSPEGPHTHVLPKLLAAGRTHAATEPVPDDFVPCAHFVPAHPVKDAMGRPRAWDAKAHAHFQSLLASFGDRSLVALKQSLVAAIEAQERPERIPEPASRFERHSMRVTLRQMAAAPQRLMNLPAWLSAFDKKETSSEDDYGHA